MFITSVTILSPSPLWSNAATRLATCWSVIARSAGSAFRQSPAGKARLFCTQISTLLPTPRSVAFVRNGDPVLKLVATSGRTVPIGGVVEAASAAAAPPSATPCSTSCFFLAFVALNFTSGGTGRSPSRVAVRSCSRRSSSVTRKRSRATSGRSPSSPATGWPRRSSAAGRCTPRPTSSSPSSRSCCRRWTSSAARRPSVPKARATSTSPFARSSSPTRSSASVGCTCEMAASPELSIVVTVLNEEGTVGELYERTVAAVDSRPFELLFVDDGSSDMTFEHLRALHERDPRVRAVRFTRNFGQHPAMHAGFTRARGEILVTMDGDLQNQPEDIPKLVAAVEAGADVASGRRHARRDSWGRTLPSLLINGMLRRFTGVPIADFGCAFNAYRRRAVEPMLGSIGRQKFTKALVLSGGASVVEVDVAHAPRQGSSRYSPLRIYGVVFWITESNFPGPLFGGTLIVLVLGIQGFILALVGEYLGRIQRQVEGSPLYTIAEEI